jgi:hypothetical protein
MVVPRDGDRISPSGRIVLRGRRGVIIGAGIKGTCTWCAAKVTEARRSTWCSQWCVDAYQATQPQHQREALRERDRERCALCGLDCRRYRIVVLALWRRRDGHRRAGPEPIRTVARLLTALGRATSDRLAGDLLLRRQDWWDVDHVVPISEGGHPYDPRNLRTLCPWCHQDESAAGAARRAEHRRGVLDPGDQVTLFDSGRPVC